MNRNENATSVHRRRFVGSAAALAAGAAVAGQSEHASANEDTLQESKLKLSPMHDGIRPEIAMLLNPGVTVLDLVGPQAAWWGSKVLH